MKKRILPIFMALTMGLTMVPVTAWAADTDTSWTNYVATEDQAKVVFKDATENAPKWIDRIDMPKFALDFYDMLLEASDGDGTADYLMDAKYYDLHELVGKEKFTLTGPTKIEGSPIWVMDINEEKTECVIGLETTAIELKSDEDIEDSEKDQVREEIYSYIKAAYSAFRSDHPEVFWLYRKVGFVDDFVNGKFVPCLELAQFEDNDNDGKWNLVSEARAEQFLVKDGTSAGELYLEGAFIKSDDVTDKASIANWARARAQEIINAFGNTMNNTEYNEGFKTYLRRNGLLADDETLDVGFNGLTDAGKIAYFNYWLTEYNGYNTIVAEGQETDTSFGGSTDAVSSRECISALVGKGEERGPVCVGFAAAMKVLCDTANIGCVMVESIPEEIHAWNYVQVDNGDWFGMDTTWDEGDDGAHYLLANKSTMDEEHTAQNDGWGSIVFPDSPAIQTKYFAFAPGWLVDETAAAERITEIKEVKIDGIVAPVLGETPVTTGFTIDTENVSITKDGEGVNIPITWTDKNGAVVEGTFAANTVYKATFVIEPASGYTFGDTKVTITGAPAGTKAEVKASDGTVTVTFPATEEDTLVVTPSSGGSSSPKYKVSVDKDSVENGSVEFSNSKVKKGSTVKITVTPDEGYMLDELRVLDKDGNELELTDLGNGVYSFKMPKGGVEVEASFEEIEDVSVVGKKEDKTIVLTIGQQIIQIDGEYVVNDVAPVIRGERTVLPIRVIAEALGATVTWSEADQKVTITKDDIVIEIFIGEPFALVNGEPVQLDMPAFIENGRTYLPLRFIMENLGADVVWNQDTQQVTITYNV